MESGYLRSYLVKETTNREWTLEKVQIAVDIVEALRVCALVRPADGASQPQVSYSVAAEEHTATLTDFKLSRYQSE